VSQDNVEIVRRLHPRPDVDFAQLYRDDASWAAVAEAVAPFFASDLECVHRMIGGDRTYTGMAGLRASWLDWLAPWVAYRFEIEDVIDWGERVLVLVHDFGRRGGSTIEVKSNNAAIWTLRDGKVTRTEFYVDRAWARRDAGLEDG